MDAWPQIMFLLLRLRDMAVRAKRIDRKRQPTCVVVLLVAVILASTSVLRRSRASPALERSLKRGHVHKAQQKSHFTDGDPLVPQVTQGQVAPQRKENRCEARTLAL